MRCATCCASGYSGTASGVRVSLENKNPGSDDPGLYTFTPSGVMIFAGLLSVPPIIGTFSGDFSNRWKRRHNYPHGLIPHAWSYSSAKVLASAGSFSQASAACGENEICCLIRDRRTCASPDAGSRASRGFQRYGGGNGWDPSFPIHLANCLKYGVNREVKISYTSNSSNEACQDPFVCSMPPCSPKSDRYASAISLFGQSCAICISVPCGPSCTSGGPRSVPMFARNSAIVASATRVPRESHHCALFVSSSHTVCRYLPSFSPIFWRSRPTGV